jgi:hypothetical protein
VQIEGEVAHAGAEVMQVCPHEADHDELDERTGHEGLEGAEGLGGREAHLPQVEQQRNQQEQHRAGDPVQDRHKCRNRQPDSEEIEVSGACFRHRWLLALGEPPDMGARANRAARASLDLA